MMRSQAAGRLTGERDVSTAELVDELLRLRRRVGELECEAEALRRYQDGRRAAIVPASEDASSYRLDAVLAAALDPIIVIDDAGRVVDLNLAAEATFGYPRAEILGKPFYEYIVPPSLRWAHRNGMQHYLATGISRILGQRVEVTALHADGSEFPVELGITEIWLQGRPYFAACLRDLTESKRAAAAEREGERHFRTLFENSPDAIFVERLDGIVLDVNPAACRLHGVAREALVGRPFSELVAPDRRDGALQAFARLAEGDGQPVEGFSRTETGEAVPVELRASRLIYRGQPAVMLIVRDITERRDFEARLRARENHLRTILESEPECVKMVAADGTLLDMNPAGLAMIEAASLEQVRGTPVEGLLLPPYRAAHRALIDRVFRGEPGTLEFEIEGLKGTRRWMETHAVPLRDDQGRVTALLAVSRDVTTHKQSEQALIAARDQAEEMSRLKSAFLNNMSHEIRTPLTAIIGFSDILAEEAPEPQQELARLIQDSGKRLLNTLSAVLDLSMLEAGSLALEYEWLDVAALVQERVAAAHSLAREKGVHLTLHTDAPEVRAYLDRTCLDRIVSHLLDNAIKFTEEGRVDIRVAVDAGGLQIGVADTGVGISESFRPYLFEAFNQESSGITRTHIGAGLGLSVTRRMVTLMGGDITVRSEKHRGSVFEVSFPRTVVQQAGPDGPAGAAAGALPRRPRILAVEDSPEIGLLLEHMLSNSCDLTTTQSEEGALALARQSRFDLVLMDINLGGGRTGEDVLKALRALPCCADVPVVAMTAYALLQDRERFLEAGFNGYLSKPFTTSQLEQVVNQAFAARPAGPERPSA